MYYYICSSKDLEKMSEAAKNLFVTIVLWTTIWANKDKSSFTRFFPSKGKEAENEGKVAFGVESERGEIIFDVIYERASSSTSSFRQMLMTWHKISGFDSQNPGILCFLLFVKNNESLFTHLDKVLIATLLRGKFRSRWRTNEFLWSFT